MSGSGAARTPRIMNPLWIISLFLGVSELAVSVAATQSDGWVRSLFATFAVTFPTGVAGLFFAILWKRPFVLYAPGDFPRHIPVSAFVDAMRSSASLNVKMVESMVSSAVEAVLPTLQQASLSEGDPAHLTSSAVEEAAVAVRRAIEENSVYISLRGIDADQLGGIAIPVFDSTTVSDLLNQIWFHIADYVPAYSYGHDWELLHAGPNETNQSIVSSPAPFKPDSRLLVKVGIRKGDTLAATRLRSK